MTGRKRETAFPAGAVAALALVALALVGLALLASAGVALAQNDPHGAEVYGVRIGMDVPTALEAIFRNSGRPAGKERPDAKRNEGKDNKDVRVLYKDLKEGNVQIVFAEGRRVREIVVEYAKPLRYEDLRLLESSSAYAGMGGERYDTRYSVGFTSDKKQERYWWREEKTDAGYRVRVGFVSNRVNSGPTGGKEIVRKIVGVAPEDEAKFRQAAGTQ